MFLPIFLHLVSTGDAVFSRDSHEQLLQDYHLSKHEASRLLDTHEGLLLSHILTRPKYHIPHWTEYTDLSIEAPGYDDKVGPFACVGDSILVKGRSVEAYGNLPPVSELPFEDNRLESRQRICPFDEKIPMPWLQSHKLQCVSCDRRLDEVTEACPLPPSLQPGKYIIKVGTEISPPFSVITEGEIHSSEVVHNPIFTAAPYSTVDFHTHAVEFSFIFRLQSPERVASSTLFVEYRAPGSRNYETLRDIAIDSNFGTAQGVTAPCNEGKLQVREFLLASLREQTSAHRWRILLPDREGSPGQYRLVLRVGNLPPSTHSFDIWMPAEPQSVAAFTTPAPQLCLSGRNAGKLRMPVFDTTEQLSVQWNTVPHMRAECQLQFFAGLPDAADKDLFYAMDIRLSPEEQNNVIVDLGDLTKKVTRTSVMHLVMECSRVKPSLWGNTLRWRSSPFVVFNRDRFADHCDMLRQVEHEHFEEFAPSESVLRQQAIDKGLSEEQRRLAWPLLMRRSISYMEFSRGKPAERAIIGADVPRTNYENVNQKMLREILEQSMGVDMSWQYYQGINDVTSVAMAACGETGARQVLQGLARYWLHEYFSGRNAGDKFLTMSRLVLPLVATQSEELATHLSSSDPYVVQGAYAHAWNSFMFVGAFREDSCMPVMMRLVDFFLATDPLMMPLYVTVSMLLEDKKDMLSIEERYLLQYLPKLPKVMFREGRLEKVLRRALALHHTYPPSRLLQENTEVNDFYPLRTLPHVSLDVLPEDIEGQTFEKGYRRWFFFGPRSWIPTGRYNTLSTPYAVLEKQVNVPQGETNLEEEHVSEMHLLLDDQVERPIHTLSLPLLWEDEVSKNILSVPSYISKHIELLTEELTAQYAEILDSFLRNGQCSHLRLYPLLYSQLPGITFSSNRLIDLTAKSLTTAVNQIEQRDPHALLQKSISLCVPNLYLHSALRASLAHHRLVGATWWYYRLPRSFVRPLLHTVSPSRYHVNGEETIPRYLWFSSRSTRVVTDAYAGLAKVRLMRSHTRGSDFAVRPFVVHSDLTCTIDVVTPRHWKFRYPRSTFMLRLSHLYFRIVEQFERSPCNTLRIPQDVLAHKFVQQFLEENDVIEPESSEEERNLAIDDQLARAVTSALAVLPSETAQGLLNKHGNGGSAVQLCMGTRTRAQKMKRYLESAINQVCEFSEESEKQISASVALMEIQPQKKEGFSQKSEEEAL